MVLPFSLFPCNDTELCPMVQRLGTSRTPIVSDHWSPAAHGQRSFLRGQREKDTGKQQYHKIFSYIFVDFFRKMRII